MHDHVGNADTDLLGCLETMDDAFLFVEFQAGQADEEG